MMLCGTRHSKVTVPLPLGFLSATCSVFSLYFLNICLRIFGDHTQIEAQGKNKIVYLHFLSSLTPCPDQQCDRVFPCQVRAFLGCNALWAPILCAKWLSILVMRQERLQQPLSRGYKHSDRYHDHFRHIKSIVTGALTSGRGSR